MAQSNPQEPAGAPGASAPGDVAINVASVQNLLASIERLLGPRTSVALPPETVASLKEVKQQAVEALSKIGVRGGKTRRQKHSKAKKHRKTRRH